MLLEGSVAVAVMKEPAVAVSVTVPLKWPEASVVMEAAPARAWPWP